MIKQMTIPCPVLSDVDIESLRKASETVCSEALTAFSELQSFLTMNHTAILSRSQINQLKAGLRFLEDRYSGKELGQFAFAALQRIEREDALPQTDDLEGVLLKLEKLSEESTS